MDELKYLEEQQVNPNLLGEVEAFRKEYPVPEEVRNRIAKPPVPYYGREILEMAIAALLGEAEGETGEGKAHCFFHGDSLLTPD